MNQPRFSVVIPTRDRADTLRHTLRTCLRQDFDGYEVVVSDNGRTPATRELVEELADPRVRYVRTPRPLAMPANFEYAVGAARGEYLIVVGDDDGLMPFALRELDALIGRTAARVVRWTPGTYTWPTIALDGQGGYLGFPVTRHAREANGRDEVLRAVATSDYARLPMLYINAAVHRQVVELIRVSAGRVFGCRIPDVYSAFVVGYLCGRFLTVSVPMTVGGVSGGSTGVSALFRAEPNAIAREFDRLNAEADFLPHPYVPDLPLFPVAPVAESFLRAKAAFFPHDGDLALSRRTILERCVRSLWPQDDAVRSYFFARTRDFAADDPDLLAWFDATFPHVPPPAPAVRLRPTVLGCDGDNLHLDAAALGVTDIDGAVLAADRLLGFGREPIRYDLPPRSAAAA